MTEQTLTLPAAYHYVLTSRRGWNFNPIPERPYIRSELSGSSLVAGGSNRRFRRLDIFNTGAIAFSVTDATSNNLGNLSSAFSAKGSIRIQAAGVDYTFALDGSDDHSTYQWRPSNSTDAINLYNSLDLPVEATVTISDGIESFEIPTGMSSLVTPSGENFVGPSVVSHYNQRRILANTPTKPNTLFYSKIAQFDNFNVGTKAADPIETTLASNTIDSIKHIVPLKDLFIFTEGAEWKVSPFAGEPFSGNTIRYTRESTSGSSDLEPIITNDSDILFIPVNEKDIRALSYQFEKDTFGTASLTVLASHLFYNTRIVKWAFLKERNILLCVRDDGKMLCLTIYNEHDVLAWTTWDTEGLFKDVLSDYYDDAFYFIVKRPIDGQYRQFVEKLRFSDELESLAEGRFLDSHLRTESTQFSIKDIEVSGSTVTLKFDSHSLAANDIITIVDVNWGVETTADGLFNQSQPNQLNWNKVSSASKYYKVDSVSGNNVNIENTNGRPITTTNWKPYFSGGRCIKVINQATNDTTINGLQHLSNHAACGLIDGNLVERTVGANGSFNAGASRIAFANIGLMYIAEIETLPIERPDSVIKADVQRNTPRVGLKHHQTYKYLVGTNKDALQEWDKGEIHSKLPIDRRLFTGVNRLRLFSDWDIENTLIVRQPWPYPLEILSIFYDMELADGIEASE